MTEAEKEDAKDLAIHKKLVRLYDERDGVPPAREEVTVHEFFTLVLNSKAKRIKQWAEDTGISVSVLKQHVAQKGSELELSKQGWVKAVPVADI